MNNKTPNYKARRAGVTALGAGVGAVAGAYLAHKQGAPMSGDFWQASAPELVAGSAAMAAVGTRMAISNLRNRNLGRQFKK